MLQKPVTNEEVKRVVFEMAPFKSLGIDGLHASFYQNSWETVEDTLYNHIADFIHSSHLLEGSNDTLLVLIPKINHSNYFTIPPDKSKQCRIQDHHIDSFKQT